MLKIPAAHPDPFIDGVKHPDLYLWDAWSYRDADTQHLYCLAVARKDSRGRRIDPNQRNDYPFHVRHFSSHDDGSSWLDQGSFQSPRVGTGYFDSRTLWSGSITPLGDGNKLVAYTGIQECGPDLVFQQSIGLGLSFEGSKIDCRFDEPISSSVNDWKMIRDAGYYLGELSILGHKDGEAGGPILAWRDPFIHVEGDNIHLFWGAKIASRQAALAHATIAWDGSEFVMTRLFEPVTLADGHEFTQLELPKILHDDVNARYYLLVSTCNRLYEGQTDADVDKKVRLYSSASINGPWESFSKDGSALLAENSRMFGLTVIDVDFQKEQLRCISPYTDAADDQLALTLSKPFIVNLSGAES